MPGWMWFAPLGVLIVALGLWAFRLGWIAATLTETDVINRYVARYLASQGDAAQATDCTARPGAGPRVWIVVSCQPRADARIDYPVDRFGRLLNLTPPRDTPQVPQT